MWRRSQAEIRSFVITRSEIYYSQNYENIRESQTNDRGWREPLDFEKIMIFEDLLIGEKCV